MPLRSARIRHGRPAKPCGSRTSNFGAGPGQGPRPIFNGALDFDGAGYNGRRLRIDHNYFNDPIGPHQGVFVSAHDIIGVADHNTFLSANHGLGGSEPNQVFFDGYAPTYGGGRYGDGAWSAAAQFGSDQFFFIEDNTLNHQSAFYAVTDGFAGARWALRYNDITNSIQAHGTESTGRSRGTRALEGYNNTFTCTLTCMTYVINVRSGTVLMHDNVVSGYTSPGLALSVYRMLANFTFREADGRNVLDVNGTPAQASGTATGGSSNTLWRKPELDGCRTSGSATRFGSPRVASRAPISAVDDHGERCRDVDVCRPWGTLRWWRTPLSFSSGDPFEINEVTKAFDQPGRGAGHAITIRADHDVRLIWHDGNLQHQWRARPRRS